LVEILTFLKKHAASSFRVKNDILFYLDKSRQVRFEVFSNVSEDSGLLGCKMVSGKKFLMFQRHYVPSKRGKPLPQ
jgi:hypothetical protein